MRRAIAGCLLAPVLTGCIVYRADPLVPSRIESEFASRQLSDPAPHSIAFVDRLDIEDIAGFSQRCGGVGD
jgi:hypothetical protein